MLLEVLCFVVGVAAGWFAKVLVAKVKADAAAAKAAVANTVTAVEKDL